MHTLWIERGRTLFLHQAYADREAGAGMINFSSDSPFKDRPSLSQTDSGAQEPWMPLDELVELWAAYGSAARSVEALTATSAAFAALSEECEALHAATLLARSDWQSREASTFGKPRHFLQQQEIIESLSRAAAHWFEAAFALSNEESAPSSDQVDPLPPDLDLDTLIGYTLAQRARIWEIAHALLTEQERPYRKLLERGTPPSPVFPPTTEVPS
jgi:hypothetical protein